MSRSATVSEASHSASSVAYRSRALRARSRLSANADDGRLSQAPQQYTAVQFQRLGLLQCFHVGRAGQVLEECHLPDDLSRPKQAHRELSPLLSHHKDPQPALHDDVAGGTRVPLMENDLTGLEHALPRLCGQVAQRFVAQVSE